MSDKSKLIKRKNEKKGKPEQETEEKPKDKPPKYGPMPKLTTHRIWSRGVLIFGIMIYVWYSSKNVKESTLAKQTEIFQRRGQSIECDKTYLKEIEQYPTCVPKKCGRFVTDKLVTANEANILLQVAQRGMALGGSNGGASILDLHSGALSYKDKFINVYEKSKKFIMPADLAVYKIVRSKIQNAIAEFFGIDPNSLYLTHPTFFSRLTNKPAVTPHDEYWHPHIDKETYESFHYTSLLYLNDYGIDFKGGRFIYLDDINNSRKNITLEPRKGRVSMFTSGAENPHSVERVTEGTRYAITVSFTCDVTKAISDPSMQ